MEVKIFDRIVAGSPTGSTALEDEAFREQHGMSRADYAERERMLAREAFEQEATADLEGDAPHLDNMPAGLSAKRQAYYRFHAWLASEQSKLATLESKRAELQAIIDAPAEYESTVRALVRRAADALLHGKAADESDAAKRLELETRHAQRRHQAEAAAMAVPEIERQIEIVTLRVSRLKERESEHLYPCILEAAEPIERLVATKRAEVAALETVLAPLYLRFSHYGTESTEPERPRIEIKWKSSWDGIAETLAANPTTNIDKLLPPTKF